MSNMTDKQNQQFEWAWRGILVLVLAACGWFARNVYIEQKAFNQDVSIRVSALEIKQAETAGNRFTSADWVNAKSTLDERDVNMDKRITRLEDAVPAIRQSLERIEMKLDRNPNKP